METTNAFNTQNLRAIKDYFSGIDVHVILHTLSNAGFSLLTSNFNNDDMTDEKTKGQTASEMWQVMRLMTFISELHSNYRFSIESSSNK